MPQQRTGRIVRTRATQSSNFRVKLPLHTGGSTATTQRPDTGVILPFLMPFVQRLCNVRRAVDTAQKTVVKSQSYPSLTHRRIKHRDTAKAYNKYMLVSSALLYGSTCKMVPTMLPGTASFKKRGKVTKAKPNCVATRDDRLQACGLLSCGVAIAFHVNFSTLSIFNCLRHSSSTCMTYRHSN